MRRLRSSLLALLTVAAPSAAMAADMPWGRGPAVISEQSSRQEEIGTGWYLRGDVGYARATSPSLDMSTTTFSNIDRSGSLIVGGGFGYKFSEWFRTDLTVDYIDHYRLKSGLGTVGCFVVDTCSVSHKFDGTVTPILANAYLDFGSWSGLTPYVGAGIGAARLMSRGTFTYVDPSAAATVTTQVYGASRWSPAFAAMAGFSFDLGSGIALDAGYRYLWVNDESSGPLVQRGNGGVVPSTVDFSNKAFHQARVGLRYYVN